MTITEFINQVEDFYCLSADEVKIQVAGFRTKGIAVYALDQNSKDILMFILPINATSIFGIIWNSSFEKQINGHLLFDHLKLADDITAAKSYENELNMLISNFITTPIDQRDPEPKYYLHLGDMAILGKPLYLMKTDSIPFQVTYDHKPDDGGILEWTQKELDDLKKHYPKLATTIDLIKEPVGDE